MLRALVHYWRINLAVVLGAAVATAVLSGALLVGDSVRGSLRDLTLDRLGRIDSALVSQRFFGAELAERLAARAEFDNVAPAILLRGSAVQTDSGARASDISIVGVSEPFVAMFDTHGFDLSRAQGQIFPSVVLNEGLARELGAGSGDTLLLNFGRFSHVPRDTLMGDKDPDDVLETLRVTVVATIPDHGMGRFSLAPDQQSPLNAYVALPRLQRALEQPDRVNALFVAHGGPDDDPGALLADAVELDDLGLTVQHAAGRLSIESREFVLRPNLDAAIRDVAAELGAPLLGVQSYVVNGMRVGDQFLPYSLVAALDPLPGADWSSLRLADGNEVERIADDEILLNRWAADDLQAAAGDEIELEFFVVGPREELIVATTRLSVGGVVTMDGLGADPSLTPDYPGVQDADDISDWDPPFPVELSLIRQEDEEYWDDYGAAPKAFVSGATGRRLWSTRFGSTTSARVGALPAWI